jgi:hypothetical protein
MNHVKSERVTTEPRKRADLGLKEPRGPATRDVTNENAKKCDT